VRQNKVKANTVKVSTVVARARTMSRSIWAVAGAAVLAGALITAITASGSAASAVASAYRPAHADGIRLATVPRSLAAARSVVHTATSVPPGLQPPAGNVLTAQFAASGVQVYQCTAGAWVFLEPAANLLGYATGTSSIQTAIHYKGPTWESTTDGSLVQGMTIASSPVPGSIPQLLLKATVNRGTGIFGTVTYINRLDTSGGAAPAGSCTSGQTVGVPYSAQYLFYVPGS
jgi:hypothetical protein